MQFQPTRAELAELVNQARLDRHISIRTAARIAGVPPATAQGWLAGRHFPTPALRPKFLLLVDALGLSDHVHPALWFEETIETRKAE
ncbi:MAG: helix-turn-helix transcriptional regulator [Propionicimonas sp.]|uniref:helix-turn-helix domain-containing protein n=1 Tax=Propionicimonas sp. TaxID=1955623 RepID=UPI003D12022B